VATKLVLRNTTANGITDTGDGIVYDMVTTFGSASDTGVVNTTASGTEIQWTKTAGGSTIAWISGRVPSGGFTLTTTDVDAWCHESNMNANIGGRYRVFQRTAAGSVSELGGGPFNDGIEFGTAAASMTWAGNVTDTAFAENDRILVRLYITNVGTMASGHTGTITFNAADASTGDSFFNIAETVAFKAEDVTGTGTCAAGGLESAGTGSEVFTGTGTAASAGGAGSGTGSLAFEGTGTATAAGLETAGTGTHEAGSVTGTGECASAGLETAGSGTYTPLAITGTGTCAASGLESAAVGALTFSGTGAAASAGLESAGAGAEVFTGTGTAAGAGLATAGTGALVFTGTATATAGGLATAGTGTHTVGGEVTGTGTAAAGGLETAGTGTYTPLDITGSGEASAAGLVTAGVALTDVAEPRRSGNSRRSPADMADLILGRGRKPWRRS
jgi:hypothetical protein